MYKSSCDTAGAWLRRIPLILPLLVLAACEESLPPREDPQDYLETSLHGEDGTVVLLGDLSPFSQVPGGFTVGVTNLHDEVLQAEAEISIDVTFTPVSNPSIVGSAHGDRNHLQDFSMIQNGDLLTIEPDSSALFFFQINHEALALWDLTGLSFHTSPGNPSTFSWFESGPISLNATGTAKLFKGIAAVALPPDQYTIDYVILVGATSEVEVDSLMAFYDEDRNTVLLTWFTPYEVNHYGFKVEKGTSPDDFPIVYDELIPAMGSQSDTTYYAFVDSVGVSPGTWFYRLQRWHDFGFVVWPLEPSDYVAIVVP